MSTENDDKKPEKEKPTRKFRVIPIISVVALILFSTLFMEFKWISLQARFLQREMISEGRIEFLTVNPCNNYEDNETEAPLGTIGEYFTILDSRIIEDPETVETLLGGLLPKVNGASYLCIFSPRHAVRMVDEPEKYFLICFECGEIQFSNGKVGRVRFDPYETERRDLFNDTITRLDMIPASDSCYEFLDVIANDPDTSSKY